MSIRSITTLSCVLGALLGPAAAQASNGALSQLPGKAGCLSNDAYDGSPGLCRQAVGIDGAQSVAMSPDGTSVYTAAVQSNAVGAFSRDAGTGLLTQVAGAGGCIASSATPGCSTGTALQTTDYVTVSPDGANVYVSSYTSQAVDAFARDPSTGALTQLAGTAACTTGLTPSAPCASGIALDGPGQIAISPDGLNAYVATYGSSALDVFARDPSTGALTQLGSNQGCLTDQPHAGCTVVGNLNGTSAVTVSPDGKYVYVGSSGSQSVIIFSRNAGTGALTRLAGSAGCVAEIGSARCIQANGLAGPKSIAISPAGTHVYVSSSTGSEGMPGDTVAIFSRNTTTGVLTELPGTAGCLSGGGADATCASAPVLGGDAAVTTSSDGSYVYVTASQSNAVSVFSADGTGALTGLPAPAQCVSTTGNSGQCAPGIGLNHTKQTILSPDGNFVYTVANGSDTIDVFQTVALAPALPSNTAVPAITGTTMVGQTLSSDAGTWSGTQTGYSYQWQACDANGQNCSNIGSSSYTLGGAPTGSQYTLTSNEAGNTIRVVVTAYNSAGQAQAQSAATAPVSMPPQNTALPAISGTPKIGGTLNASTGTWKGSPTISYTYEWQDCDVTGKNCTLIAGATGTSYVLTAADGAHRLRVVVTGTNTVGSASATSGTTVTIPGLPPAKTANPTISGDATLGAPLTSSTGSWSGSPTSYAYAWSRCDKTGNKCNVIASANASTYILTTADVGHRLRVTVTATNPWGSGTATSTSTPAVTAEAPASTALPTITGAARTGKTLKATSGSWTGNPTTFHYQWETCNKAGGGCKPIGGAIAKTHKLTLGEIGHRVRVLVTATGIGGSGSATSKATGRVVRTIDLLSCTAKSRSKTLICTITVSSGTIAVSRHLGVIITRGKVLYATGNGRSRTKGRLRLVIHTRHTFRPGKHYNLDVFIRKGGFGILNDVVTVKIHRR